MAAAIPADAFFQPAVPTAGSWQFVDPDVIEFYDRGGQPNPHVDAETRPVRFTPDERRALVAFLGALSGPLQEGINRL